MSRKTTPISEIKQAEAQLEQTTAALRSAVEQELAEEAEEKHSIVKGDKDAKAEDKGREKKGPGTNRGVETLFRSAYRVQMDLTGLADNKANMMISINGIIISIIIAAVAPKLDANPWLLVPTTVFLVGTLVSIIYAILAARPRVMSTPITLSDLRHSKGNILFFGNFSRLAEDDFVEGMLETMSDKSVVYETMIRNIYGLGFVLQTKFRLLKIAYNAFMVALVLGVSSYISVFLWIFLSAAPS